MDLTALKEKAKAVADKAYAPYSNFKVGCAILTESGHVYTGCNVENASYGITICAERTAITSAVAAEGKVKLKQVVVFTPTEKPATPCGVCRQTIKEFSNGDTKILSFCDSEEAIEFTIQQLLPEAFNLDDHH